METYCDLLKQLVEEQDKLLMCYRTGKRPTDALLERINTLKERLKTAEYQRNAD